MSSLLRGAGAALLGLLVEDGSLAIGIVAALAVAWTIGIAAARPDLAGWWLLGSLVVLLVANVYRAGLGARRAVSRSGDRRTY